jgi:pyroglutamyl-peptidase
MDGEIADNSGFHPRELQIQKEGENALFSTLPLKQMLEDLRARSIPARISNSAGLYVCNDLFYRLQASAGAMGVRMSGFVHVPYLPEQTTDKPSMPFETMRLALDTMIDCLKTQSPLPRR